MNKQSFFLGMFLGFILGLFTTLAITTQAYDPCDNNRSYEVGKDTWQDNPRNPQNDPAMQFYWSNHQPSLQPR